MNKSEIKQNAEMPTYYVRKPYSDKDFVFLEAVNKLMAVWDTCGSNRLGKIVEILESIIRENPTKKLPCNDLIDIFKSAKTGFIKKAQKTWWVDVDYNDMIHFLVLLLNGETRYKMIKEILPCMNNPYHIYELLVINEYATLQDIRDAFNAGIIITKGCVSSFNKVLFKEYGAYVNANPETRAQIDSLVYDIVSVIEHSSYIKNTQMIQSMYKQFGISGKQVKKADFIANKQHIVSTDTKKILEKVRQNVK